MTTPKPPGPPLRDFTVEKLESLPVGSAFHDTDDQDDTLDIVKDEIGWKRRMGGRFESVSDALDWATGCDYRLVGGVAKKKADPLLPFLRAAAEILPETPDDYALVQVGNVWLTAGDFRGLGRVGGGR